jgi:uncharacterized protein DUF5302
MTKSAKQGTAKAPAESAETESAATEPATTEAATTEPATATGAATDRQPAKGDQAAQGAVTPAGETEAPDLDETKRKFREALERKHQSHNEAQGKGGRDGGKISGAHGPAASRRNFRRKSG